MTGGVLWLTGSESGLLGVAPDVQSHVSETGGLLLLHMRLSVSALLMIQMLAMLDMELGLVCWKNLLPEPWENKSVEILRKLYPW